MVVRARCFHSRNSVSFWPKCLTDLAPGRDSLVAADLAGSAIIRDLSIMFVDDLRVCGAALAAFSELSDDRKPGPVMYPLEDRSLSLPKDNGMPVSL
jgi:hypothetical protein